MNNQDFLGLEIPTTDTIDSYFSWTEDNEFQALENLGFGLDFSGFDPDFFPAATVSPPKLAPATLDTTLVPASSCSETSSTTFFQDFVDFQEAYPAPITFDEASFRCSPTRYPEARRKISDCSQSQPTNLDTTGSRESSKRKWEDSIIMFSTTSDKKIVSRKRKQFSQSRKKEVALNRKVGACLHCKIKRLSCNFGIPCDHCLKRAGDIGLGQQICSRRNLVSTRFDDVDLFSMASWEQTIDKLKHLPILGTTQYLYLGYRTKNKNIATAHLKLPIMRVHDPRDDGTIRLWSWNYYDFKEVIIPSENNAIDWSALPTTDQLLSIWSQSHSQRRRSRQPFDSLKLSIKRFADLYCAKTGEMPLKSLIENTFRLQNLFALLSSGIDMRMKRSLESDDDKIISATVWKQLRYTISKDIIELEVSVLFEMDKLLFSAEGVGRQNPVAVWLCLWTLIFTYKEHMIMTSNWKQQYYDIYDLSRHMYNTLTAIYSALYKTTSPLTLDWRTEEVSGMLGRDNELIHHFSVIKTEMYWIQSTMKLF